MPMTVGYYGPTLEEKMRIAEILAANPGYKSVYKNFLSQDVGVRGSSESLDMRMAQLGRPSERFLAWVKEQEEGAAPDNGLRNAYRRQRGY
jgi:hypothetical protein